MSRRSGNEYPGFGFAAFVFIFIVGGNLLAWHFGWHTPGPFGYCQGYGC